MRKFLKSLPGSVLIYRFIRDVLDRGQPLLPTPWGFLLSGNRVMASGSFEPNETRLLQTLLPNVEIFVNVGANIGYYCCHAINCGCKVVAFEPVARNLYYLLRNINANGWSREIQVFPVALGSESNILPMWGGGTGASLVRGWASIPEADSALVPVSSLDRLLGSSCMGRKSLILIDVEGAELDVLKGASLVLRSEPKPIWIIEICFSEHQPERETSSFMEKFELFFAAGYKAYMLGSDHLEITREDLLEVISGLKELSSHNFAFVDIEANLPNFQRNCN